MPRIRGLSEEDLVEGVEVRTMLVLPNGLGEAASSYHSNGCIGKPSYYRDSFHGLDYAIP